MTIRAIIMILSYYTINFSAWNWLVNSDWLSVPVALILSYGMLFFISLAVYGEHLLIELKRAKRQVETPLKFIFQLIGYSVLLIALTTFIVFLVKESSGIHAVPQSQNSLGYMIEELPIFLSFIIIVIIGPFIEELTFREAFTGWVDDYNNQLLFYMGLASILLFTQTYMTTPSEFFFYLPFSFLVTDFYFRKYRNIWASIVLHSLIKLFYFVFTYIDFI